MLNVHDLQNIHKLLQRSQYEGLEEAKVAAVLAHKIEQLLEQASGNKLPAADQPRDEEGRGE